MANHTMLSLLDMKLASALVIHQNCHARYYFPIYMFFVVEFYIMQPLSLLRHMLLFQILCRVIAVGLHYLFSAAFTWMCIEGFHLYVMIVSVFRADSMRMKYYYLIGWGKEVSLFPICSMGHLRVLTNDAFFYDTLTP